MDYTNAMMVWDAVSVRITDVRHRLLIRQQVEEVDEKRVRWVRDDFCDGKSHFPEQKSFPCSFCARKSERF